MLFNNFDFSARNALFALPVLVILCIAPFAPGGVLAGRFGWRAVAIAGAAFVVYVVAVVGLVFLPLPADPVAFCAAAGRSEGFSFVPLHWLDGVFVFMHGQGQRLTLQGFLHNETLYQAGTNVGLFLPFGVGLRLIFGLRFRTALALAIAFSLGIEVTQGTGLFGFLPCAHRLGDVDDLILNGIGGALGWVVAGYLRPAAEVGIGHRFTAFAIDLAIVEAALIVVSAAAGALAPTPYAVAFIVVATVLVVVPAAINGGVTLGKAMVGIRLVARSGRRLPLWRLIVRYAVLLGVPAALFLWPQLVLPPATNNVTAEKVLVFGAELALILLLGPVMMLLRRDRRGLHDLVSFSDHQSIALHPADAPPAHVR